MKKTNSSKKIEIENKHNKSNNTLKTNNNIIDIDDLLSLTYIEKGKNIWTPQLEYLLISWAEKASGRSWQHNESIKYYKRKNNIISIPACVFGYISGTATLLNGTTNSYLTASIGICGILAGVLANLQQMFTFKELSEQHRISSLQFQSFHRDIGCELSLHPDFRVSPINYVKAKRLEYDKLIEQSPYIPDCIIKEFDDEFKNSKINKPENTNRLQTIKPYREQELEILLKSKIDFRNIASGKINKIYNKEVQHNSKQYHRDNNDDKVEVANSIHTYNDVVINISASSSITGDDEKNDDEIKKAFENKYDSSFNLIDLVNSNKIVHNVKLKY